jgi:hypothetical protein
MFPTAEKLLLLFELEDQFKKMADGIIAESKYIHSEHSGIKAREMGRASGFYAAAHMIADKTKRL